MKLRKDLMKSRTRLFLFCLFAGLGYLPSKTSGQVLFGECSAVLQRSVEQGVSGSAVGLIARGDQILWLGAAGEISPGEPMPLNAIVRLASIQKPITAAAVLMLHERKQISLADSVERWIPGFGRRGPPPQSDPVAGKETPIREIITKRVKATAQYVRMRPLRINENRRQDLSELNLFRWDCQ